MSDTSSVRWGIIGPGNIAKAFAGGLAHSRTGRLVAIGTRDPRRPGLAESFPGARIIEGYQALIDDPEVEAIYVATPHTGHAEWAIKAAEGGKHVLVEKPMGISAAEAEAMIHAARKAGTFLAEAFMYRVHPMTAKLVELVATGAVGEVRKIQSSFGFALPWKPEHRLLANDTAGGGVLDVGCYPASIVRLLAGAAAGKPFLEPSSVAGVGHLGETGVDEWASAVLKFPNEIVAEISCSVSLQQDNTLRVFGTTGWFELKDFWFASGKEGGTGRITIHRPNGQDEVVEVVEPGWLYSFEADAAGEAIRAGRQELASPGMSWADTLGNLALLDKWRAGVGLEYGLEQPARRRPVTGRPLARQQSLRTTSVPGLEKPVSAVAMGFEYFETYASAATLLDRFYELGGSLIDTAYIYRGGKSEGFLGHWLEQNGVRDEISLIGKGVHSPLTYPDVIGKQLTQSLERLKTGRVEVYFMHRDNEDIPVGEFVDALDAEVKAGRIGIYGGSNWSRARMDAAFDYAQKNGKTPPGALSNNFSLAEMVSPVWAGCVAASDDEWKAWLAARNLPVFAWSSQGRGFFTDRAGREKFEDEEIVRCWYSEKNFARRDRAVELAQQRGVKPIHIALAYVLHQPFPVVPLIGPRGIQELEDSLSAVSIELSPEEVRWLEAG